MLTFVLHCGTSIRSTDQNITSVNYFFIGRRIFDRYSKVVRTALDSQDISIIVKSVFDYMTFCLKQIDETEKKL